MQREDGYGRRILGDSGVRGLSDDVVVAGGVECLEIAAPAPIGDNARSAKMAEPIRQRDGRAGKRQLESHEVDR